MIKEFLNAMTTIRIVNESTYCILVNYLDFNLKKIYLKLSFIKRIELELVSKYDNLIELSSNLHK